MSDNPQESKDIEINKDNIEKEPNKSPEIKDIKNSDIYEDIKSDSRTETLDNLDIGKILQEQEENDIKYNFKNIDDGKQNIKERYIKEKLEEISSTIKRMSHTREFDKEIKTDIRQSAPLLKTKSNFENYEKESERRKCETEFLLIVEKAIISFNLKKFMESYTYLENSGVIKNLSEFGKFLLVVNGFDKGILGEFLAKEKPPNENKNVLNTFINTIDLNYKNNSFLECLRFLLTRIILPKDANLILVIMDTFSEKFFTCNKKDPKFVSIFCNINAIYLLVSTILALNTMFTRKDIKNMNIIKKEEFKSMNKDINANYLDELYEELKKKPISLSDDYSEEIYKKLAPLVLVRNKDMNTKNLDTLSKDKKQEKEEDEDDNENNENDDQAKINMLSGVEQQYFEFVQEFMDLDIVRKTLRGNYNRKKSYSMNTSLLYFNQQDKNLLSKPNKFYKISGPSAPILREFIVFDDFKKLANEKSIEPNQQKFKKFIEIGDINDVYIGQGHGDNIKKYIKAYPQEEKLVNNFISIVYNNHKEQLDIKSDNLSLALQWFKAMKSLVIQTRMKKEELKVSKETEKQNEIREKITSIWDEYILLNLDNYMKFIIIKCYEKYNFFNSIIPPPEKISKLDLFDEKKILNAKTIEDFLKEINDRFERNEKSKLEYQEFFSLCFLGFPHKYRKKMWKIFIGNDLSITKKIYIFYQKDLMKDVLDFGDMDLRLRENANVQFSQDFKLNQILMDIIKSRYIFIQEINKQNLDDDELLQKIYNITYVFNIIRSDIPYNKGIVLLAYLFLLAGFSEIKSFKCIMNLICSRNIIKFYIGDTDTINRYLNFFTKLLEKYAKEVSEHLNKLEIKPELYLIPWFEKLFTQSLDYDILLHVFDLYIVNGEYILFQTAITIIKLLEEDLLNLTISEVFKLLKRLPKKYTDLEFFEKFKNYNCISDEFIRWNKHYLLKEQIKSIKE